MANVDQLLENYKDHIALPWHTHLSGAEKVVIAVYSPREERRLRTRIEAFELASREVDHGWVLCDLTDTFEQWLAGMEYREAYFERPSDLSMAYEDLLRAAAKTVEEALEGADHETVVGVLGAATLFGFLKVSDLIGKVQRTIRGRLLVFFPGAYDDNKYRLLDVRDGWNYQAVPVTS